MCPPSVQMKPTPWACICVGRRDEGPEWASGPWIESNSKKIVLVTSGCSATLWTEGELA